MLNLTCEQLLFWLQVVAYLVLIAVVVNGIIATHHLHQEVKRLKMLRFDYRRRHAAPRGAEEE